MSIATLLDGHAVEHEDREISSESDVECAGESIAAMFGDELICDAQSKCGESKGHNRN